MEPVTLFLTSLGAAVGKSATGQVFQLGRELVGLEEAQLQLLRRIDVKVDALIAGPFHTGRRQLADATAPHREKSDAEALLKEARTSFTKAVSQDVEPLRRSLAAVHLAAVWLLLGSAEDVRRSLRDAHFDALRAVGREAGRKPGIILDNHEKRRQRVHQCVDYANALADARRSSGTPAVSAPVVRELQQDISGSIIDPNRRPTKMRAPGASGALGQTYSLPATVWNAPTPEEAERDGIVYESRVDAWIAVHTRDPG